MTDERIAELRRLVDDRVRHVMTCPVFDAASGRQYIEICDKAANALPELLDEVERLRKLLPEARP